MMSESAFARFYASNARLPGPLGHGGAEAVVPGALAPLPDAMMSESVTGESDMYDARLATGLGAMAAPGEWATAGGADAWRQHWMSQGALGGAGAVAGVATARGFGSLFASTSCLPYANGVCAMHGAPILPGSLAVDYEIETARPGLLGAGRVERCGCGIPKTKLQ